MSKKTKIKLIIGAVITVIIIYFSIKSLSSLHLKNLFNLNINWFLFIVSVIVYAYANYIRGLCYTRGLDRNIDRLTALQIVGIGHAANMILPLHAGEGLRIVFFPDDYSVLKRTKLLVIPAAADFAAIMVLSILAVPFAGFKDRNLLRALWILTFLCIAGCVLFVAAFLFVPKLKNYAGDYLNVNLLKMMFWVLLSWVLLLFSTWIGLVAYGFDPVPAISMSLAVFAATNIINFIPASPGAIGLFEYGTILALGGLGIGKGTALQAALLLHILQYAALLPLGAVLYVKALHGKYGNAIKGVWRDGGSKKAA